MPKPQPKITIRQLLIDFVNLMFPNLCVACSNHLIEQENYICTQCLYNLPKTNFHRLKENPVSQMFWGRVKIEYATAYCFFQKGGTMRKIIHHLKYKGMKEVGYEMGKHFGAAIKQAQHFEEIDLLVPVPLHKNKLRQRGYNQSYWIAKGMGEIMNKPVETESIKRNVETNTQTRKARYERWENVEHIFKLKNEQLIRDKHILLVDDVVTTGSTLEACASALLKAENTKVSIATLGVASN